MYTRSLTLIPLEIMWTKLSGWKMLMEEEPIWFECSTEHGRTVGGGRLGRRLGQWLLDARIRSLGECPHTMVSEDQFSQAEPSELVMSI